MKIKNGILKSLSLSVMAGSLMSGLVACEGSVLSKKKEAKESKVAPPPLPAPSAQPSAKTPPAPPAPGRSTPAQGGASSGSKLDSQMVFNINPAYDNAQLLERIFGSSVTDELLVANPQKLKMIFDVKYIDEENANVARTKRLTSYGSALISFRFEGKSDGLVVSDYSTNEESSSDKLQLLKAYRLGSQDIMNAELVSLADPSLKIIVEGRRLRSTTEAEAAQNPWYGEILMVGTDGKRFKVGSFTGFQGLLK